MVLKESKQPTIDTSPPKERLPSYFQIAIDGPMGAGKSTISELVSKELGILFISTGQLYRSLTLLALRSDISVDDEDGLLQLLAEHEILLKPAQQKDDKAQVILDGEDVTQLLNTKEMGQKTPLAARHLRVRAEVVKRQQALVESANVIMEGRDITHTVLPGAQLKIYLTADPEVRATRRFWDLKAKGENVSIAAVLNDLIERDKIDSEKNLRIMPGAWVIDNTDMSIEEVVKLICDRARAMTGKLL